MAKKEKNTFLTPLHLACGGGEMRPVFNYIHFMNDMAYATDGHVLVEQSMSYYCNVINRDMLNGHSIHADAYKFISKCHTAEAIDTGIWCTTKGGAEVFYPYVDVQKLGLKIPNFLSVMTYNPQSSAVLGVTAKYMAIIDKVLYKGGNGHLKCELQGDRGAIIVTVPGMEGQKALWMPVNVGDI